MNWDNILEIYMSALIVGLIIYGSIKSGGVRNFLRNFW